MVVRKLQVFLVLVFLCLSVLQGRAQFGIGVKIAQAKPLADFGATFKKTPSFELIAQGRHRNIMGRLILSYAKFQPRQDTIPVYMVEFKNGYTVQPGGLSFRAMNYIGITVENQVKIIRKKDFELLAGAGMSVTKVNFEYDQYYDQGFNGLSSRKDFVVGFNAIATGLYHINEHISVFADLQYQYATFREWSSKFHNRKIGLGLIFTFNEEEG